MVKLKFREQRKRSCHAVLCACVAAAFLLPGINAFALSAKLSDSFKIDVDTTLTYGIGWRLDDADSELASEGNNNFDKGDQINNYGSIGMDVDAQWEHFGVFLRGRALYDGVYVDKKFPNETVNRHGKDVELLDAFIYTNMLKIGDWPISIRAGRQSISWGESLFIGNSISTAQSPLDGTKANTPGTELKDLFLPTGAGFAQITSPSSKVTLAGYYKWEWEKSRLDERGSFFSTNDAIDDAGDFLGGFFPRTGDGNPRDGGEYGVALRYLADNGTEFGLYYLNYHETFPNLKLDRFFRYYLDYQEDVTVLGASVAGGIGPVNVNLEISYRPDLEVPDPTFFTFVDADVLQANFVITYVPAKLSLGNFTIADSSSVSFEWVYQQALNQDDDDLLTDSDYGTGGLVSVLLDYYNVINGLDVTVPLTVIYNPGGTGAAQAADIVEDKNSFAIGADLTFFAVYKLGIKYTNFFGDSDVPLGVIRKDDRDNISINLKYTF